MKKLEYPVDPCSRITVSKLKPSVAVSSLTAFQQRVLWEGIKQLDPGLAELIKNDAEFNETKTAFNATLMIELTDFNRLIQAGQKRIEEKHHAQTVQLDGSESAA